MIDFGNTLSILEEDEAPKKRAKYRGDSAIYQEAKSDADSKEKYDDKYDLDEDQGTEIEPVDVELDDDDEPKKDSDDDKDEESDTEEEEDDTDKKKSKKKKTKKTTKKGRDDDLDDDSEEDDEEDESDDEESEEDVDFEEEGFAAGANQVVKSVPKAVKKYISRETDAFKGLADDMKTGVKEVEKEGIKGVLNLPIKGRMRYHDRLDDLQIQAAKDRKDIRHDIMDAFESKNKVDHAGKKAKNKIKRGVRDAVDELTEESYQYIETVTPRNAKQDIDRAQETQASENNYYTAIANSSKDLEHLYKTLLRRADKETVIEELTGIYSDLKELREEYYQKQEDGSVYSGSHKNHTYQGMKRIIDQDISQIDKYLEMLQDDGKGGKDGKPKKISKNLVKKTIKCINNLQQDMITECERSQPRIIRHIRDIGKKLWLFESYDETDDGEITQEGAVITIKTTGGGSEDDGVFDKVGKLMVQLRKQKERQELAEKNGIQINGMRYTDDTIMNIATSVVALLLAKNDGDPRYRQLCQQGMAKRALKVELINAYKNKANDIINQYDNGPIEGAAPYHDFHGHDGIEIVSDEDEIEEEYYVDPETGEMKSIYQEADDDTDDDKDDDEEEFDDLDDSDDDKDSDDDEEEEDSEEDDKKSDSKKKDKDDDEEDDEDDSDDEEKEDEKEESEEDEEDDDNKDDDKDDEEEDDTKQESYYDRLFGRLYQEADDGDNGYTMKGKHGKDVELDGTNLRWEVKPRIKVEDIKFGDSKKKIRDKLDNFGHPTEKEQGDQFIDDYGKFQVFYNEYDKCEAVKILDNGITIEIDHSVVFPGDISNLSKKALDLKPGDGKSKTMVSRIMSIEIETESSNKMKSIKFARSGYFIEQQLEVFDKIAWHVDKGVDEDEMIKKFKEVYKFLHKYHLLSPSGKEEMRHLDSSSILSSRDVNEHGNAFLHQYYDKCTNYGHKEIYDKLESYYRQFNGQSNEKGKDKKEDSN